MKRNVMIPDRDEYRTTLTRLIDQKQFKTLLALRMGCELGMTRLEIVSGRISDLDRYHTRGLWVEIAKRVRRGNKFEMRQREIPVNPNLYALLQSFLRKDQAYLLYREKGDRNKPFAPAYLNKLYKMNSVSWATHGSRHFFKNSVMDWMRAARQVDEGLLADLLGHKKTMTQSYGSLSWDYKRDVIDQVFR